MKQNIPISPLKKYRLLAELSQRHLAALIGVAQPVISQYESGLAIPEDRRRLLEEILSSYLGETISLETSQES